MQPSTTTKVLITGATKGIGRAIANAFAKEGAELILCARSAEDLRRTQEELVQQYPSLRSLILPVDLSTATACNQLIEQVTDRWEGVDVLINNAGLYRPGAVLKEATGSLEAMMQLNVYAPYRLSRAFSSYMEERRKGHIINICSVASRDVRPGIGSYAATKYALLALTRAMRQELLSSNVAVTAILPGQTWSASWEGAELPDDRLMQAEDVATAVIQAWKMAPSAVVEEIVLRPQLGDL